MSFKGEIAAAILASKHTDLTVGDVYRIVEEGKLGNTIMTFGTFVEWNGTAWKVRDDLQLATNEEVSQLIDDTSTTGTRPSVEGDFVNKLIVVDGKVAKITDVRDGTTAYVTTDIVDELNAMQWKDVTVPPIMEGPYTIPVHDKENVSVPYIAGDNIDLLIQCDETCRNARLRIQKQPSSLRSLTVKRGNNTEAVFGTTTLINITYDFDYAIKSCLVSELGCDAQVPTDFSDVGLYEGNPVISNITKKRSLDSTDTLFAIEITPLYAKLLVL